MKRLGVLLLVGCAACGSEAEAPTPLPVSGAWSSSQLVQAGGTTCGEGGTVTIAQSGARLSLPGTTGDLIGSWELTR
jgi:hypothetical protein